MIAMLQRVSGASVKIGGELVASIDSGLLVLLGVERDDSESVMVRLLEKTIAYRIFEDKNGRMNLSVCDAGGGLLVVPQFTLTADTSKGLRPGFSNAADPGLAEPLFLGFVQKAKAQIDNVQAGVFGADMAVQLVNTGPCTFSLKIN